MSLRIERGLPARLLFVLASMACCATSVSAVQVMPHWGLAGADEGARAVKGFRGGVLDLRMGKVSAEGSFELGIALHARDQPVVMDLLAIEAWLDRERVTAGVVHRAGLRARATTPGLRSLRPTFTALARAGRAPPRLPLTQWWWWPAQSQCSMLRSSRPWASSLAGRVMPVM